jgi:hypothetical protein
MRTAADRNYKKVTDNAKKGTVVKGSSFLFTISFEGRGFKYMNSFVTIISIAQSQMKIRWILLKNYE